MDCNSKAVFIPSVMLTVTLGVNGPIEMNASVNADVRCEHSLKISTRHQYQLLSINGKLGLQRIRLQRAATYNM